MKQWEDENALERVEIQRGAIGRTRSSCVHLEIFLSSSPDKLLVTLTFKIFDLCAFVVAFSYSHQSNYQLLNYIVLPSLRKKPLLCFNKVINLPLTFKFQ